MKHYKGIAEDLFHIQSLGNDCFQDRGNYSTIPKCRRNTTPIKPTHDVWHYDICYGAGVAIGEINILSSLNQKLNDTFSLSP